jgi:O-methyltransferase
MTTSWKQAVNATLVRTIGYQLERPKPGPQPRTDRVTARLEAVTKRLEKLQKATEKAIAKPPKPPYFPDDFDEDVREVIRLVRPYTRTSKDKLHALVSATRYLSRHAIEGDVVECGVWRGGSMHAVARVLDGLGDHSRDLYLFDTFDGMTEPTEKDLRTGDSRSAKELMESQAKATAGIWAYASLEDVQEGFASVPYPAEKIHYVQGKVEDTVPAQAPERISLLRLDTDWYESTRHELEHLYPRLVPGGVLIIDDYGSWQGSTQATDEFLEASGARLLLLRAGTGRIAIKP